VTGLGVVCAGAKNVAELRSLLASPRRDFRPPTVFPCTGTSAANLPAAEVTGLAAAGVGEIPRTHRLALLAAREALGDGPAPDAIVWGRRPAALLPPKPALKAGSTSPDDYRHHGLDTVALHLANALRGARPRAHALDRVFKRRGGHVRGPGACYARGLPGEFWPVARIPFAG
jgi:hypothetical protein